MKRWIAHEHDETGWPTESCLIVTAPTQADAKQVMNNAITEYSATATRQNRDRLLAIFTEGPEELPTDDPRHNLITDPAAPTFLGFN
jgi:hypothetical protein